MGASTSVRCHGWRFDVMDSYRVSFVSLYRRGAKDSGYLSCQVVFEVWLDFSFDKMAAMKSDRLCATIVANSTEECLFNYM